jgi:hypothetical protein
MPTSKATRSLAALGAALLALALGACGSSAAHVKPKWGDTVARVGRYTITRPELERWIRIESILTYTYKPVAPVPPGVIFEPPDYTACVELAARTLPHGTHATKAQLRTQCATQRQAVQGHILEILVTNDWMHEEARRLGVTVPSAEVDHMVSDEFSSRAHFERYLRLTGEHEGDYQWIVESELLVAKLQKQAASKPGLTAEQRGAAEGGFGGSVIARWTPRTSCAPGYVIYVCREFKPHAS